MAAPCFHLYKLFCCIKIIVQSCAFSWAVSPELCPALSKQLKTENAIPRVVLPLGREFNVRWQYLIFNFITYIVQL